MRDAPAPRGEDPAYDFSRYLCERFEARCRRFSVHVIGRSHAGSTANAVPFVDSIAMERPVGGPEEARRQTPDCTPLLPTIDISYLDAG